MNMWGPAINVKSWIYKTKLFRLTTRHCTSPTRPLIHQSSGTIQHHFTRELTCFNYSVQPYRLPHDHHYQKQMTTSVANHWFSDIILKFGIPRILCLDSGTEFRFKLMEHLFQQLSVGNTFISPPHLQANGKLELSHRFIKDCIWKFSVDVVLEWDQ